MLLAATQPIAVSIASCRAAQQIWLAARPDTDPNNTVGGSNRRVSEHKKTVPRPWPKVTSSPRCITLVYNRGKSRDP